MLYVTLGDQPSGVYEGQVLDVCQFLDHNFHEPVRLIAFISLRGFKNNKEIIKKRYAKSVVVPMFPKLKYWYLNTFTLALICLFYREQVLIGRSVLATKVALALKRKGLIKKVCYDGRGAIASEWHEYKVVADKTLVKRISTFEKDAVLGSDFRIAVSQALVLYWKDQFGYAYGEHVVIPCTLSSHFKTSLPSEGEISCFREKEGYSAEDLILVYAGSTAGWQSFSLLQEFLSPVLAKNKKVKVLFLSREDQNNKKLKSQFPEQVRIEWVKPEKVNYYLSLGDYGILLREETQTNKVAAPTKFAEYLISGLRVVISKGLGDYTHFVEKEACGEILDGEPLAGLKKATYAEKERLNVIAKTFFLKDSFVNKDKYLTLVQALSK